MIESAVNVNQHRGSGSTLLDCSELVSYTDFILEISHTNTGGSIGTRAFGSTGCPIFTSSSPSVEMLESDLTRLAVVFWVSALCSAVGKREDMLFLCRTEAWDC